MEYSVQPRQPVRTDKPKENTTSKIQTDFDSKNSWYELNVLISSLLWM